MRAAAAGQHLSDEAVAAFADGVLRGHARERAERHSAGCAECAAAVRVQREAAWALRVALPPSLPTGLADRLRGLPQTTPLTPPPTVLGPDGAPMLPTTRQAPRRRDAMLAVPAAAFVPPTGPRAGRRRVNPMITTLAVVAVTGGLVVGARTDHDEPAPAAPAEQVVHRLAPTGSVGEHVVAPVALFRPAGR